MIDEKSISSLKGLVDSAGTDYAEIRISEIDKTIFSLRGDSVETVSSGISLAGSVRIFDRGNWTFLSFNSIEEVQNHLLRAKELSMKLPAQKKELKKQSKPVSIRKKSSPVIDFAEITPEQKFALCNEYNNILKGSPRIQTTRTMYRDAKSRDIYVNSEGSDMYYEKLHCGVSLSAIAKEGNEIQTYQESFAGYGGFELVNNRHAEAEKVIAVALELLEAQPIEGGKYSVITDPRLTGVFIHEAFGHLSEADFVYENNRMKKLMTLGKVFGPQFLNVVDDGSIEDAVGYIPLDDEGVEPRKNYLIKNGELCGRLHSRETAGLMNEELTGNARAISAMAQPIVRMTNTYIENGKNTKDELFEEIGDGVYAVNAFGGQTNLEMFTFSSAYGRIIKDGKPGKMVKNVMLSGNVFDTLKNVRMAANDMQLFGGLGGCGKGGQGPLPVSFGGPHLLIDNVLIGGNQ
ncbi:MAG TPA: TldD/PmbA family protein [Spirochaetota bacterium]|nr:TldD/PmbA family protein [Spirochaetota bacterium]